MGAGLQKDIEIAEQIAGWCCSEGWHQAVKSKVRGTGAALKGTTTCVSLDSIHDHTSAEAQHPQGKQELHCDAQSPASCRQIPGGVLSG